MTTQRSENRPMPKAKKGFLFIPTLITVSILFLGIIGYLLHENSNKEQLVDKKVTELEEVYQLKYELETEYNNALADLDDLKGQNEELDYMIEIQEQKLKEQKGKITNLLKSKKLLKQARVEIDQLKIQVEQYMADVENLEAKNEELAMQNQSLFQDREVLTETLQSQIIENTELNEVKAVLVSQRDDLAKTVHFASVIKVDEIDVTGVKTTNRGKSVTRKSAKSVDQLKVCFTTHANEIVEPNIEKFYIRIVNPAGETLAIEDLGSGSIQDPKTGEDIRYTQATETEYDNTEQNLCFLWEPKLPFQPGNYDVEIYNKGYLSGKGSFVLK